VYKEEKGVGVIEEGSDSPGENAFVIHFEDVSRQFLDGVLKLQQTH